MSPSSRLALIIFLSFSLCATPSTALSANFSRNFLSSYRARVETFFASSVLNSTQSLTTFLAGLPPLPLNASVTSGLVDDLCDVDADSADTCFERLPADPRSQILLAGEFLAKEGELKEVGLDCATKVAPLLLRQPLEEPARFVLRVRALG